MKKKTKLESNKKAKKQNDEKSANKLIFIYVAQNSNFVYDFHRKTKKHT